ncbi:MAG: PHP domain-containing protein [Acidimicrobiia bacterium]|nr:PHP domain-containing protein [Acidimicrobiia bacterium]
MAVDLHLHSTFSDGSATPAEIVAIASDLGLSGIALTDHDTLEGLPDAAAAAERAGLRFIGGTELSVLWREQSMHLLVYCLEPGPGLIEEQLAILRRGRNARNEHIVELLRGLGIDITYADVLSEAGGGVVGRPHFAGVLVNKGIVTSVAEAFDRFLAQGRPAYAPRQRLAAEEAIAYARATGAVPVIAHPHTLNLRADEYADGFAELVDRGLGGIESFYAEYSPELRQRLASICSELGIVATGGSDYHGKYKPQLQVGIGNGDLRVPDEAFDRLLAAR